MFSRDLTALEVDQDHVWLMGVTARGNDYRLLRYQKLAKEKALNVIGCRQILQRRRFVIGLTPELVIHKTIALPDSMRRAEVATYVALNLERLVGLTPAAANYDYTVTADMTKLQLVAAKRESIQQQLAWLGNGVRRLAALDLESVAMLRAVQASGQLVADVGLIAHCRSESLIWSLIAKQQLVAAGSERLVAANIATVVAALARVMQLQCSQRQLTIGQIIVSGQIVDHAELIAQLMATVGHNQIASFRLPETTKYKSSRLAELVVEQPVSVVLFGLALWGRDV